MMIMSSETQDFHDQENVIGKPVRMSWNPTLGTSNQEKGESIWKQKSEVSNVWGTSISSRGAWSNKSSGDEFTMFQGAGNNGLPKSEDYPNWVDKGEEDGKMNNTNSFGLSSTSSDLWYPTYDPFKKSWPEVDFTSVTSSTSANLKKAWDSQLQKNIDSNPVGSSVLSAVSTSTQPMEDNNLNNEDSAKKDFLLMSTSGAPTLPKSSSTLFSPDNPQNDDTERSQPDGAEGFQQNKEEMIAKMVNSHEGWGKKPIRQDTPWQMESLAMSQAQSFLPDANLLMPAGCVIGSDTPKLETANLLPNPWSATPAPDNTFHNLNINNTNNNNNWGNVTPSQFPNPPSNPNFFPPSMTANDWASDSDISLWNGPPPPGCDMTNPNLWNGPPKEGGAMWPNNNLLNSVNNNNLPLWPQDGDKGFWGNSTPCMGAGNEMALGGLWSGASKMPADKGLLSSNNQFVNANNVNQAFKSVGMWNDAGNSGNNRQMEFGVWNQPREQPGSQNQNALQILMDVGLKKEEAVQLLLSNNFNSDKLLELMNSAGRTGMGMDPPRGRMLRGKSVIETTTDFNQQFAGRAASAFQPPQQPFFNNGGNNNNMVSQQLQQQLLLQKVGLLSGAVSGGGNVGIQHGRSSSMVPKLDSSGFNSNTSNNKSQQLQQLQMLLQLQSVLQPLLVERAQLQQNTAIPLIQKKNRLDVLNVDIIKVKALIDQLQLYGHTGAPTPSLSSSSLFNQSDPTGVEEARLLQALGHLKLDQISPTSGNSSMLGGNSNAAADLVSLLQNTAGSNHGNNNNSWLPNMYQGDNIAHTQPKEGWSSFHGKSSSSSSSFGGMFPPPPPGLNSSDKLGGGATNSFMGQQGMFNRSTSWAPGGTTPAVSLPCWLLIKNTSVMDGSALYSFCSQSGTLQQLLSNKITGHSIACFRDDPANVQAKLQQLANLSSECLANKDMLRLLDASNSGGTASAWVAVTSSTSGGGNPANGGVSGTGVIGNNNNNNNNNGGGGSTNNNNNNSGASSLTGSVVNE